MASVKKIHLLHNSSAFAEIETKAGNVRELREEQSLGGATININRVVVNDDHSIEDWLHIAAVNSHKTGG